MYFPDCAGLTLTLLKMTTALSNSFRTQRSGISAQDLIKLQNSVVRSGLLRTRKRLHIGKWPHRFVVLTHDSLYVYVDETSKAPHSILALLGYNRVARCDVKGQDWCFSIIPEPNMKSMKTKTLACSSDFDRKLWMQAIKSQIYVANNIPKPKLTVLDKITIMTGESIEDDYSTIELAVYGSRGDETGVNEDSHVDDKDYDSADDSDTEINLCKKTARSMSLPYSSDSKISKTTSRNRTFTDQSNDSKSSNHDVDENIYEIVDVGQGSQRRLPSDAQPQHSSDPASEDTPRPASDPVQMPPPRYSEVYSEEPAYVNLSSIAKDFNDSHKSAVKPSLESLCTLPDTQTDRKYAIDLLHKTKLPGTYLIRKSQKDSNKVLALLDTKKQVKEYKLFGTPDSVTIDGKQCFACLDELLEHYTSVELLMDADCFLASGFYKVKADLGI